MRQGGAEKRNGLTYAGVIGGSITGIPVQVIPFHISNSKKFLVIITTTGVFVTDYVGLLQTSYTKVQRYGYAGGYGLTTKSHFTQYGSNLVLTTAMTDIMRNLAVVNVPQVIMYFDDNGIDSFIKGPAYIMDLLQYKYSHKDIATSTDAAFSQYESVCSFLGLPFKTPNINPNLQVKLDATIDGVFKAFASDGTTPIEFFIKQNRGKIFRYTTTGPTKTSVVATDCWLYNTFSNVTNVSTADDQVSLFSITGTKIKILSTTGTLPVSTPQMVVGGYYYVIRSANANYTKFTDTLDHALAGTNIIDITAAGTGTTTIEFISAVAVGYTALQASPINATVTADWEESEWGSYVGFPEACTTHESRVVYGYNREFPNRYWGSYSGRPGFFMQQPLREDLSDTVDTSGLGFFKAATTKDERYPYAYSIAGATTPYMNWLLGARFLFAGTYDSEYQISGGDRVISPDNLPFVQNEQGNGTSICPPVRYGETILYSNKDEVSVMEMTYDDKNSGFVTKNISVMSDFVEDDYLLGYKIVRICYHASIGTVWILARNLTASTSFLYSFTLDKGTDVRGWAKHTITGATEIIDICTTKIGSDREVLMCIIRREAVYSLEYLNQVISNTAFMDASISGTQASSTTITLTDPSGFYNGQTVSVVADGIYVGEKTVHASNHTITLDTACTTYIVGFNYVADIATMKLEPNAGQGTSTIGAIKRVDTVTFRLFKSGYFKFGTSFTDMETMDITEGTLFTGDKRKPVRGSPDITTQICIRSEEPYPCKVLAIAMRGESNI